MWITATESPQGITAREQTYEVSKTSVKSQGIFNWLLYILSKCQIKEGDGDWNYDYDIRKKPYPYTFLYFTHYIDIVWES